MTGNALAQLHIGQEVKLHTYFQVREDAMVLYGFFKKDAPEAIYFLFIIIKYSFQLQEGNLRALISLSERSIAL